MGHTAETRLRSAVKAVGWRIIAIINSFIVLANGLSESALSNALYMNLTGLILYYSYERICNYVTYGRVEVRE